MHEFSIASSLMERIEAEAERRHAAKVVSVGVSIGEVAGVEVELLHTAYNLLREGTVCAHAPLRVERVPVRWSCPRCHSAPAAGARLICPVCKVPVRLVSGDEIVLARIELEVP
jgi:hydrogenase nickel incorporation protein HypA/HybF